jgi:hypothetical protein
MEKMHSSKAGCTIDSLSGQHVGATYAGGLSRDLKKWILFDRGLDPFFPVVPEDGLQCVGPEGSTDVYRVSTTAFVLTLRTDARRWGGSILRLGACVRFLHGSILDT